IGDVVSIQVSGADAGRVLADLDGFVEIEEIGGLVGFTPRASGSRQQEETRQKTQKHVTRTVHKPTIVRTRHRWRNLARIIHDRFYCNRGYAAATGGLATQSVNVLLQVRLPLSWLQAPVSPGVCAISSRTVMNSPGCLRRPCP